MGCAQRSIAFTLPAFNAAPATTAIRTRRGRYYCAFLIDPDGNNIEAGVYA
jgi:hypothetical protein